MSEMLRTARLWLCGCRAGVVSSADWVDWADATISTMETAPDWLIAMLHADDERALYAALAPLLPQQIDERAEADLIVGLIWMRYRRGELSIEECLRLAAEEADANDASIECESIYALLSLLELGQPEADVVASCEALFADVEEAAVEASQAIGGFA